MKKRILSLCLAVVLALGLLPTAAWAAQGDGKFTKVTLEDGTQLPWAQTGEVEMPYMGFNLAKYTVTIPQSTSKVLLYDENEVFLGGYGSGYYDETDLYGTSVWWDETNLQSPGVYGLVPPLAENQVVFVKRAGMVASPADGYLIAFQEGVLLPPSALPQITVNLETAPVSYAMNAAATPLTVTASGTSLTYQWCKSTTSAEGGFVRLEGETGPSLVPQTAATSVGTAWYKVEITNGEPGKAPVKVDSAAACVRVDAPRGTVAVTLVTDGDVALQLQQGGGAVSLPAPAVTGGVATYFSYLTPGAYTYQAAAREEPTRSLGGGTLEVTADASQRVSLALLWLYPVKTGWAGGADFTTELKNPQNAVMTPGSPYLFASYQGFPYVVPAGTAYTYTITPTEKRVAEGYRQTASGKVVLGANSTYKTESQKLYKTTAVAFALPAGATLTVRPGPADYVQSAPLEVASGTASTYDLVEGEAYHYRVSAPGKVTYGKTFKMAAEFEGGITVTEEMLSPGGKTPGTVVRDLSANGGYHVGDLYLNINETGSVNLAPGDTLQMVPQRSWQTVSATTGSPNFTQPDYRYTVLDPATGGESVAVVTADANGLLTAHGAGTALVLVTYDAVTAPDAAGGDPFFGAIWPENTGVAVVTVGAAPGPATHMTLHKGNQNNQTNKSSGARPDAELDVLYYTGEGYDYSFTPEKGSTVTLLRPAVGESIAAYPGGFSAEGVTQKGNDFTVTLTNGRNIVKVEQGGGASYQVLTAKKQSPPTLNNLTNPGSPIQPGDRVQVVLEPVYLPVNPLAGLYRFTAKLTYTGGDGQPVSSTATDYATLNQFQSTPATRTFTVTIPKNWDSNKDFTLTSGGIEVTGGSGGKFGDHRKITKEGLPSIVSATRRGTLGSLPDITIPVEETKLFAVAFAPQDGGGTPLTDWKIVVTRDGAPVATTTGEEISIPYGTYGYTVSKGGYLAQRGAIVITKDTASRQTIAPKLTAATGPNPWDGVTQIPAPKNGDTYEIATAEQLAWFGAQISSGAGVGYRAKLTADIELAGYDWTPMGGPKKPFQGSFDGDGHSVEHLSLAAKNVSSVGLFGSISGATVQNVTLKSGTMDIVSTNGAQYFAPLVGSAKGGATIRNCVSRVDLTVTTTGVTWGGGLVGYLESSTVENCQNYGAITSNQGYLGGIVGNSGAASSAVKSCTNHGAVTGGGDDVGGIISSTGGSNASILDCANTGAIRGKNNVGGIAGAVGEPLRRCCNTGDITGALRVGGIAGKYNNSENVISDVYNTGAVRGENWVGGLVGQQDRAKELLARGYSVGSATASAPGGAAGAVIGSAAGRLENLYFLGQHGSAGGIGSGTPASGTATAATQGELKTLAPAGLGSSFVPDAATVNGGYPILLWQAHVTDLKVTKLPHQIAYTQGDSLNLEGMEVTATVDGKPVKLEPTLLAVTPTRLNQLGAIPVTVSYLSFSDTFSVTVSAYVPPDPNTISLETTLTDGMTQKGSRRTFDVIARDPGGKKIPVEDLAVTLNGGAVDPTWDDANKTSYTLRFTKKGENTVSVRGLTKTVTYRVEYTAAKPGEVIGQVAFALEAFTLGGGYLIPPKTVEIREGENSAKLICDQLTAAGFTYRHTGAVGGGFYLSSVAGDAIADIDAAGGTIPQALRDALPYRISPRTQAKELGEFDYTQGAGWMYCLGNIFPNVGFSDTYPGDGDVVRAQFTLAYGADIGGGNAGYVPVADKDALTALLAEKGVAAAPRSVLDTAQKLNATQREVDGAVKTLQNGVPPEEPAKQPDVKSDKTPAPAIPFADVAPGDWCYSAVQYVAGQGWFLGTDGKNFLPAAAMGRGMLWTVLSRRAGAGAADGRGWAMAQGISDGRLADAPLTRQELAVMLYRSEQGKPAAGALAGFADAGSVADWAREAMEWAVEKKLIFGRTPTTLAPEGVATRSEVAVVLWRMEQGKEKKV